jgi:hypothetical protein
MLLAFVLLLVFSGIYLSRRPIRIRHDPTIANEPNFQERDIPESEQWQTPPPIPVDQWYYLEANERLGPVAGKKLQQKLVASAERWNMLVWRPGLSDWTRARDVPELQGTFDRPPLPYSDNFWEKLKYGSRGIAGAIVLIWILILINSPPSSPTFDPTSAPQPPAKHYTLETIILEAEEATANMTMEVKDISAIVHVCRLSQMRGAGYTDLQIAAAPRYDGLLETNEECDKLVKTFNGNFELLKRALEISSRSSNTSSSISSNTPYCDAIDASFARMNQENELFAWTLPADNPTSPKNPNYKGESPWKVLSCDEVSDQNRVGGMVGVGASEPWYFEALKSNYPFDGKSPDGPSNIGLSLCISAGDRDSPLGLSICRASGQMHKTCVEVAKNLRTANCNQVPSPQGCFRLKKACAQELN